MSAESRLKTLRKHLGLTQQALATRLGVGKSALSMIETGRATLSERNRRIIAGTYNVRSEWLEKGRGPMFDPVAPADGGLPGLTPRSEGVPLYDVQAAGGLAPLLAADVHEAAEYLYIPGLPRCDGAVRVGDDIVIFRRVEGGTESILWGELYLVEVGIGGESYILVRRILRSEISGRVKLEAEDGRSPEKEIAAADIRAFAIVKAAVKIHKVF